MANILVIADTHLPFQYPKYLDFCKCIQDRCKCEEVVHIGDLVDNHAISYHEHDPDGWSPEEEMAEADKHLQPWFKAFPVLKLCRGNHDRLVDRKGRTSGLPSRCFKEFKEIWNLPSMWTDEFDFEIDGVRFMHGTGYSGKYGHVQACYDNRQSTVIGHLHSVAGTEWVANPKDCVFGMCVGSGLDRKAYTFAYGKDFKRKPILACGVITDSGQQAQVIRMIL